ncbi:uridine kinase [Brevibacterium moorei]|uniref:uridine kinase n=1 Tax=Brevibacterium moorei TaxID=2968457 RepID=UPI00211BB6A5|nr:uridine kinase [Brevibacterium sp. 68QC2CO]MCQ9385676.1 uridine kinase [Brevibacterium sp. 68QC2CO]
MKTLVVGVAGGTGSGKTTLTNALVDKCGGSPAVLYHDNYYKRQDGVPMDQRALVNYDAPEAFDNDLFVEHLCALKDGIAVDCPVYDFAQHNRSDKTVFVEPARVLIVEGILIFAEPEICRQLDIKLFVDTDADVRIMRRIKRDVVERGRSLKSVEKQYLETVKPMHELYVEPSKRKADLIIPDGGYNLVAMDMILNRIQREVG